MAEQSILKSVKNVLMVPEDYDVFDQQLIMHINGALSSLDQIGVGPEYGLAVEDDSTLWRDLLPDDPRFNMVKNFIYLKVRLIWDPPGTSFLLKAIEDQIAEYTFRINVLRESGSWVSPAPVSVEDTMVLDGGGA